MLPALVLAAAGCGSGSSVTTQKPTVKRAVPTAPPTPAPPATSDQGVAVGRAIFPVAFDGGYLECDAIAASGYDTTNCPMSARLLGRIARYAANYHQQCPQGCDSALPIIRDRCGSFPNEQVTTGATPAIVVVQLSGDATCRGVAKTFFVSVIIENGAAVADDIDCNKADPKYGMYNPDPKATVPRPCA